MRPINKFLAAGIALLLVSVAAIAADYGSTINGQGPSLVPVYTITPVLGNPGKTAGTLSLANTSNAYTTTISAGTGQSGNITLTLPSSGSDTFAGLGTAQTWTAAQTFTNNDILILGSSTGTTTLTSANSGASNYTLTLPAATDTVADLAGTQTFTNKTLTTPTITTPILDNPPTPGGRLSYSSTLPVPHADLTSISTIYYLPYQNNFVPVYNGTNWQEMAIGASGVNFTLGATNMPTSQVYDIYAVNVSGTLTLCSMYWGGNTSRSTTAGGAGGNANASITQVNGIWVNSAAIATNECFGGASGTTAVAIPINQGTLLGSYYTTGSASTEIVCNPSAASGGTAVVVGLSNAYNRVNISCSDQDSNTSKTSTSASWAVLGSGDNATWVDSLQQVNVTYDAHVVAGNGTAGDLAAFGVACTGSGTSAPSVITAGGAATATLADNYNTLAVHQGLYPVLGLAPLCYAEIQDPSAGGTATYMPVAHYEDFTINLAY